ncbi:hypothetical protein CPB85DRAFT_1434210 [Mucidula mucida]|nr:hypothetical protein CPB85DRAFT_1434210 [Mucidula mucida]
MDFLYMSSLSFSAPQSLTTTTELGTTCTLRVLVLTASLQVVSYLYRFRQSSSSRLDPNPLKFSILPPHLLLPIFRLKNIMQTRPTTIRVAPIIFSIIILASSTSRQQEVADPLFRNTSLLATRDAHKQGCVAEYRIGYLLLTSITNPDQSSTSPAELLDNWDLTRGLAQLFPSKSAAVLVGEKNFTVWLTMFLQAAATAECDGILTAEIKLPAADKAKQRQ